MRLAITCSISFLVLVLPATSEAQTVVGDIVPSEFSYLGGTPFSISGAGFPSFPGVGVTVEIDGVPATVTSVTSSTITGVAPAHAPEPNPLDVQVTFSVFGLVETATLNDAVTYIGPLEVTSLDPAVIPADVASQDIIITGVGFTPSMEVELSLGAASPVLVDPIYIDARRLRIVTDLLGPGVYDVTVISGGASAVLPDGLLVFARLSIEQFDPDEVSELGATPFTLTGSGFTPETVLDIGGMSVVPTFVDATTLTGTVPPNSILELGVPVPVTAIDPASGVAVTLADAFEYVGPFELLGVNPAFFSAGLTPPVSIVGVGMTADMQVEIGGVPAAASFSGHQLLTASLPSLGPGIYDVRVFRGASEAPTVESVLPYAITIAGDVAPSLESITPSVACADGGTFVTITGQNFIPGTEVRIGGLLLQDPLVGLQGTTITGTVGALLFGGSSGPVLVSVEDFRGGEETDELLSYTTNCPTLRAPDQFESSVAYGTARFSWHNPETYDAIEVLDGLGNLLDVVSGDTTEYEVQLGLGESSLTLQFRGVLDDLSVSLAVPEFAQIYPCDYPPPQGGAVVGGDVDLPIRGGHAAADIDRCSDGDGPQGPFGTVPYSQPSGSTGLVTPQWVIAQQLSLGWSPLGAGNVLKTGFTLEHDADRLEFGGYYQKVAGDFGLSLRGRLIHVFPDDGFTDEFTFPDPEIGAEKAIRQMTYFRATEDVSSPTAQVCTDSGGTKRIPAGDYILEIYAVGGDPQIPYYVWGDDPRDNQIFIEGVPCPPYPMVQVRDMTGLRTLPTVTAIDVKSITENPDGKLLVTLGARGTWFDEDNNQWKISPDCDAWGFAPAPGGGFFPICLDDLDYKAANHVEYEWSVEGGAQEIDDSVVTLEVPDWGCYGIDLIVRDLACGVERKVFYEIALVPDSTSCTPDNPYFSFLFPTPNPSGIHAIANLRSPSPGNGTFGSKRPLEVRVLVTPPCYCDGISPCAGAFINPAPEGPSDELDDVQFRLAVKVGSEYHDLNADVWVKDLCPDTAEGAKYFLVYVEDLGEIPWSPFLDDQTPRTVYMQGRTNCMREIVGGVTDCDPMDVDDDWHNVGGPMKMMNHPEALDAAFWHGYCVEETQTYHFSITTTPEPEESFAIDDSEELAFGIVDAGVPAYEGNVVNTGFTSRVAYQPGGWFSENGTGSSSGSLLENELATAPQVVEGEVFHPSGAGPGALAYQWCDHQDIFDHSFSQELFRAIIYAGFIGPIPVNIWGSVGLNLAIAIDSYLEFRVSPFDPLPSGNYAEMQYTLVSQVDISIPCQIGADILGGIASVVLRLRPVVEFDLAPYIIAGLGSSPEFDVDHYIHATFELLMEAEACIQTLILGEQCLPAIVIPLIAETDIIDQHGTDPTPSSCGSSVASAGSGSTPAGGIQLNSYEIANAPVSVTSPDGLTVVDAWVSAVDGSRFLKVCITEAGQEPIVLDASHPGLAWYFLDPKATWVDNDRVIFVGTGPPGTYTPEIPPSQLIDPDYLAIRNANAGYTEIQIAQVARTGTPGTSCGSAPGWCLDVNPSLTISDATSTPVLERKADGRATIAADLDDANALVAWVRYAGDYLIEDGVVDVLLPEEGCGETVCVAQETPNIRPQMEATSIVVRRVDFFGTMPGEDMVTISDPGPAINVQPAIALSPSNQVGYCAWIHDPNHTDLLTSNQGRQIQYAIYDKSTDTWSPPMDVLLHPEEYPGMLEPYMILKDDQNGMLAFTALPEGAPEDDSGLGGGSRLLYASRLVNGVFEEPILLRGRCQPRQYGWEQSMFLDLPILVDQLDLHMLIPDYFMVFQDFGPVGDVSGSGNVMISVFSEATNDWTPAQALMPAGSVMTNVTATAFNGALHSVHFDAGPATASAVLAGPPDVGYKIHDTKLEPDAAIRSCELSQPFASPGSPVSGVVEIENLGFVSTPYHETTGGTAVGLQIVFIDQLGQHIVMQEHPIDILRPGEVQTIEIEVEMPHDPVMIQARLFPNPIDRDRSNDERTCFFGAPAPENLMCSIVETVLDDDVSEVGARLEWDNPALYDMILVYRDGGMIRSLPGNCSVFTDIHVDFGLHRYDVRGVIAASKSAKTGLECIVDPPPPTFRFLRGDTNVDGDVSLADAIVLLNHVFDSDQPLPCLAGGDTNFDGNVNIADAIWLLSYLFTGGEPPADPFPTCGESSEDTDSALGCDEEGC